MSRHVITAKQSALRARTKRPGYGMFFRALTIPAVVVALALASLSLASPAAARVPRIKRPGAPTNLEVVPTSGGGVVSWSAPVSDGGSPITGYEVIGQFPTCTTAGTTCTLTGLRSGKRYFVTARASNARGYGAKARVAFIVGQSPDCDNLTPGADLEYCGFKDADLAGDDLAGADLYGANLFRADLQGADLSNVILTDADINYANFTDTTLSGTFFDTTDPSLSDYIVSGGVTGVPAALPPSFTIVDGYLVGPAANLSGADLAGASMVSQSFLDANLTSADLAGADLTDAYFRNADLSGSDVSSAVFTGATWDNTTCPDGTNSNDDADTCLNDLG